VELFADFSSVHNMARRFTAEEAREMVLDGIDDDEDDSSDDLDDSQAVYDDNESAAASSDFYYFLCCASYIFGGQASPA